MTISKRTRKTAQAATSQTLRKGVNQNRVKKRNNFPIVGIGASAGGLEALTGLLKSLQPELGMAFVFVPHLDPSRESAFTQILARDTQMPVIQITDEMQVEQNHVYVIPPNRD